MIPDDYLVQVRYILQEPTADIWADAQLMEYLNWAADSIWRAICERAQNEAFLEETAAFAIVNGQVEYTIPQGPDSTDCIGIFGIERVWSGEKDFLGVVPLTHRNRYTQLGAASRNASYPQQCYLKFPKFGLVPAPTSDIASALVVHGWFAHPVLVTGAGASAPRFDAYLSARRACIIRTAMFAKHVDETQDSALVGEYKLARAEMIVGLSMSEMSPQFRTESVDEY